MKKTILILGYGKSTQSAIDVLQKNVDADICVFDEMQKDALELPIGVSAVTDVFELAPEDIFFCLKSPGIAYTKDYVQYLSKNNVEIVTDVEYFLSNVEGTIVAITGTNGKTTVTTLIGEVLKTTHSDVRVCGNIGVPIAEVCENATKETIFVVELSSFQLKGTSNFKPDIAVVLNIADAHLDYHQTKDDYIDSKAKVFANQTADDILLYNGDDAIVKAMATRAKSCQLAIGQENSCDVQINESAITFEKQTLNIEVIKVPGIHNRYNVAYAYAVGVLLGVSQANIEQAIQQFTGVKHRLQYVRSIDDIRVYNDSKSTNEYAVQTALSAFDKPLVWICGGYDRHIPYNDISERDLRFVKKMVIYGQMQNTYIEIAKRYAVDYVVCEKFDQLFETAMLDAKKGDVVLFSPGAASYDMFQNFEQRGDAFLTLVENYSK